MKKLFYSIECRNLKVECFKLDDRNELTEPAYEVRSTNLDTGDSDFVEAYQPQAAIALADEVMEGMK